MIELINCSKWYKGEVIGLNDVTCQIPPGVTALLGMNGAGKSTMMKLVTGQMRPTTGQVLIDGEDPFANPRVFRKLGYCPEIDNFYEWQTGRQFVYGMARYSGYSHSEATQRTNWVIEEVGMTYACDRRIGGYSKGMRQRIKIAQAMLHEPETILLDEPLTGLDPVVRREIIDLLRVLAERGKSILLSSHILREVEQMTRSILLLNRGRLRASGDMRVIRDLIDKYPHRVHIVTPEPREVARRLVALPYVLSVQFERDGLELQTREPSKFYDAIPSLVLDEGVPVTSFSSPDNNLESIFRYLVNG